MPILIAIFAILIGLSYAYFENVKKKEAIEAAEIADYRNLLQEMEVTAKRLGADATCNEDLFEKNTDAFMPGKTTTADIQRCWLQSRPVLFRGEFVDVSLLDETHYTIFIRSNRIGTNPKLQLALRCDQRLVDSFRSSANLAQKKKKDWDTLLDKEGIAVIAQITHVSTVVSAEAENKTDIKIGSGNCLALLKDESSLKRFIRSR